MRPHVRPLFGGSLLLTAAIVWGLAFAPQRLSVESLQPLTATAMRFTLAAAFMLALAFGRMRKAPSLPWRSALQLGAILYLAYALQTAALKITPVARVSLITGLYAVFVPLLSPLFGHRAPTKLHWLGALVAFIGTLGLVGIGADRNVLAVGFNRGDVFTLLHALLGAVQVLLVGRLANRTDAITLNAMQVAVIASIAVPVSLVIEGPWQVVSVDVTTGASLVYLAVFSTALAFTCQLIGQKHASPSAAAVIMLLETPIGVLASVWFLHEQMLGSQWLGSIVLLLGVIVSLWAEARAQRGLAENASDGQHAPVQNADLQ